ncbi:uncharacterized protein [Nicotiana sylvestris]|uniref:uncharacterized protein n=1 Tax=Nicotiana sylvestris TaxID=4096 RepID=UPI00388C7B8A
MVNFEAILGMDWLSLYHAILDCHAKIVTLSMQGLPRLEWIETPCQSTSIVVSYLKAPRMTENGYLAYLAYIDDSSTRVLSIDLARVMSQFPEAFPTDLTGMSPGRDIDFCIDLVLGTQLISIVPYHMDPTELKELKDQLQDLLEKGFN